jgi:hypothetical protein
VARQVSLHIQLPESVARRLEQAAAVRDVSIETLAIEAIEHALRDANLKEQGKYGYRWKDIFLPDGTLLSFDYKGTKHLATVVKSKILHEGKPVSPSEFVNSISDAVRNAWRDIWIRRPSDTDWLPAYELRREVVAARLTGLANSMARESDPTIVDAALNERFSAAGLLESGRRRRFGSLPISERMGPRYFAACRSVIDVIERRSASQADLEHISEAKGMFNRIVRRDRHDWQHVQQILGMPTLAACRQAAAWLVELRILTQEELPLATHCTLPVAATVKAALYSAESILEREGFGVAP